MTRIVADKKPAAGTGTTDPWTVWDGGSMLRIGFTRVLARLSQLRRVERVGRHSIVGLAVALS